MNENFVLVLTDDGAVHTISISTGRAVQSWHASLHSSCVAWGAGGRCVYLSDDKGAIHAVPFDPVAIRVLPGNKTTMRVSSKHVGSQVHSLIVRPHLPPLPHAEDVIIAGTQLPPLLQPPATKPSTPNTSLRLLNGRSSLHRRLHWHQNDCRHPMRAPFCPLRRLLQPVCIPLPRHRPQLLRHRCPKSFLN
jgi:hypothetical protein